MARGNLPISYWGHKLLVVVHKFNLIPSKPIETTPYELWVGRKHNLRYLRPWSGVSFVTNQTLEYGKLSALGKMYFQKIP